MKRPNLWEYDPRTVISITVGELTDFANHLIKETQEKCRIEKLNKIFTTKEVCDYLKINHQTLLKYRNRGQIGFVRVDDKIWFTGKDIEDFLNNNQQLNF